MKRHGFERFKNSPNNEEARFGICSDLIFGDYPYSFVAIYNYSPILFYPSLNSPSLVQPIHSQKSNRNIHIHSMASSSATAVTSISKHQKGTNQDEIYHMDRISNLPDHLLCQILSLLPTKNAVGTSILSTRWNLLWTSIYNLDFDDNLLLHYRKNFSKYKINQLLFMVFMDNVLHLFNAPFLHKFRLKCRLDYNILNVSKWICGALERNVRELDLSISMNQQIELPPSLFTCKTLEVLKLSGNISFNIPQDTTVCLPHLTILHLHSIYCAEFSAPGLILFPNLKILRLTYVECENNGCMINLISCSPILEGLVIKKTGKWESVERVDIHAPALTSLDIDFSDVDGAFKLLRALPNVKCLSLPEDTLRALRSASQYVRPALCNITRLQLRISFCDFDVLFSLMDNMDKLEHLICAKGDIHCYSYRSRWTELELVPKSFWRLKTISIDGFYDCTDNLEVVSYVLKKAIVLEKMTIKSSMNLKARFRVLQKISTYPRGSTKCAIAFS